MGNRRDGFIFLGQVELEFLFKNLHLFVYLFISTANILNQIEYFFTYESVSAGSEFHCIRQRKGKWDHGVDYIGEEGKMISRLWFVLRCTFVNTWQPWLIIIAHLEAHLLFRTHSCTADDGMFTSLNCHEVTLKKFTRYSPPLRASRRNCLH